MKIEQLRTCGARLYTTSYFAVTAKKLCVLCGRNACSLVVSLLKRFTVALFISKEEIIRMCHSMHKPVIVATNMLESMIGHPLPTRLRFLILQSLLERVQNSDAIMLLGKTAHGKEVITEDVDSALFSYK